MTQKKSISILLVDDEVINLENVGHFLENHDFEVTKASNGKEALEQLSRSHFDLVITDLKMGDVDGLQVMKGGVSNCETG